MRVARCRDPREEVPSVDRGCAAALLAAAALVRALLARLCVGLISVLFVVCLAGVGAPVEVRARGVGVAVAAGAGSGVLSANPNNFAALWMPSPIASPKSLATFPTSSRGISRAGVGSQGGMERS